MTSAPELIPDAHFLSASNPLATSEQRDLEARAMRILPMPAVQAGREAVAQRWRTIAGREVPDEAWSTFDELVEEFTFNYVLKAVNISQAMMNRRRWLPLWRAWPSLENVCRPLSQ